ncbi:MAG: cation:proton antiporter, partial [Thermoprotei archaeon]|nr:cation:proton antiporter [Thermoprotei archaeon]
MGYISAFVDVSLIIFLGFIASYLFEKHKVPEAMILIIAGILIGPVFKIISPTTFEEILSVLSNVALVVVLFEAGLSLNLSEV